MKRATRSVPPARQLAGFLTKYTPEVAAVARAAIRRVKKQLPGMHQLVYDNYNALAIAFASSDRRADIAMSVALYPRWVSLFFMNGPRLPDPQRLLKGSGTMVRHIVLEDPAAIDSAPIRALIRHARAAVAPPAKGPGKVVIKSISPKQRPRRPR